MSDGRHPKRLWSAGPTAFLGINYNGMHDSSVCLADADGGPVYAVSEERFSRIKQDGRFPHRALAGVDLRNVAAVGVPYLPASAPPVASDPVFDRVLLRAPDYELLPYPPVWLERLEALGLPLLHFDHHEMHAYTGYVLSGYEEALVLTGDYGAYSCPVTMGVFQVSRGQVTRLGAASASQHEALAAMYTDVTALLGFTPCKHEGKITGLSGHGRPDPNCRRDVWALHRRIRAAEHRLYDWVGFLDDDVPAFYEPNRHLVEAYRAELPYSDADIARAAQDLLHHKLREVVTWIADTYAWDLPLVLSGGLFANVRGNLEVAKTPFPAVFVTPAMGDDGLSIGAAAAAAHATSKPGRRGGGGTVSMALGPDAGADHVAVLSDLSVRYRTVDDPARALARLIADRQLVALVRGRAEFGPRALGQRSILGDARDAAINDQLNQKLGRTEFMPFAPVLRAERVNDVFDLSGLSPVQDCLSYMTICLPVRDGIADLAPAVVHVDGTARPQVVTEDADPFLHRLLTCYEEFTGSPVLINTSFNLHDEPLVTDARDALAAFFLAGLDVLFLDGLVVDLADNRQLTRFVDLTRRSAPEVGKKRHRALNRSFGRQMVDGPGRFSELSDPRDLLTTPADRPPEFSDNAERVGITVR
jgi:carbamoyltransferase